MPMRFVALPLLLAGFLGLTGCGGALQSQPAPSWTTGFWIWQTDQLAAWQDSKPLDILYVHVGTIEHERGQPWSVWGNLPVGLPPAREYWLVLRFDRQDVPAQEAAPLVATRISQLRALAQQQHLNVAGVQLDIDCPTRLLTDYAKFLHQVRANLPSGLGVSITALLDWFRDGTAIGAVIGEVDEFIPQFYDLAERSRYSLGRPIAAKLDSEHWGPIFNRFDRRFRIGISSFGRATSAPQPATPGGGYSGFASYFADATPLDFGVNPAFSLQVTHDDADETVLTYRATKQTRISYSDFKPGAGMQFILPTAESVKTAVRSARQIGGNCAGVVFFRWPGAEETLVMRPEEVLAASGAAAAPQPLPQIRDVDGSCAAVSCADLYLVLADPLRPTAVRYRIHSSAELEYFLPEERMPVRMTGPSELELSLPPYGGRRRMLLGRAVSKAHADFTVQEGR